QPRYRIGGSFFLPGEEQASWRAPDLPVIDLNPNASVEPTGGWLSTDMLVIPLRNPAGQLLGLMSRDDPRNGKRPDAQTVEALEIFSNQAAFAIENSRLVEAYQTEAEATRRERDRLAQLHLVASEIQRAADIPTRLQVVADGIRATGWSRVAI